MNSGIFSAGTSNRNDQLPTIVDDSVEWDTVECDVCGEEYRTLRVLSDLPGPKKCSDCRDPLGYGGGHDPGLWRESRSLMEYGPLSHGESGKATDRVGGE